MKLIAFVFVLFSLNVSAQQYFKVVHSDSVRTWFECLNEDSLKAVEAYCSKNENISFVYVFGESELLYSVYCADVERPYYVRSIYGNDYEDYEFNKILKYIYDGR